MVKSGKVFETRLLNLSSEILLKGLRVKLYNDAHLFRRTDVPKHTPNEKTGKTTILDTMSPKRKHPTLYFSHTHFHKVQTAPVCSDVTSPKSLPHRKGNRSAPSCSCWTLHRHKPLTKSTLRTRSDGKTLQSCLTHLSSFRGKSPSRLPLTATPNERVQEGTRKKAAGPFPFYLANETPRN